MQNTFKAILLIALLLMLPVRGFAAVTMQTNDHQGHAMSLPQQDASVAMAHDHDHSQNDQHDHNKQADTCNACGACCTGAVPSNFSSDIAAKLISSSEIIAYLAQPYRGFIPEGPERPPRLTLR